ncbi:DUF7577 domain-containing protein [Halopiger goleimassiliensis]|uniref:DUF7577 domain-containing protein n=1 Tax=Halopiger goleimassiliensis TaxID=1293048 RepID=UPI000677E9E3|nr:hypothetical protein [Halopiger goleimassiliensis]
MDPVVVAYWLLPIVAFVLFLGAYTYFVYRRLDQRATELSKRREAAIDRESGSVVCPDCGAENDLGYTYCRRCVGELPGGANHRRTGGSPARRGIV